MSLEHAILGFLNYIPFSGYDLKKIFDASVQHFWPVNQSHIYRSLSGLAEQGWAEVEVIRQENRPDRKVYHITAAGREELRRWLSTPLPPEEVRSAFLIQVFFAGQLNDDEILAIFERLAEQLRGSLEQYDQVPNQAIPYKEMLGSPGREDFFWMLTLECGIALVEARLKWVESVIHRIRNREYPAS